MPFIDTNVLLYAVGNAVEERDKRRQAMAVLERSDCVLSVQVLQEFYVQATNPRRGLKLNHDEAVEAIQSWLHFRVQPMSLAVLERALWIKQRYQVAYWDAAILAAASAAGCREVWSEDLSDGQDYDGVRVNNPFKGA